MHITLHNGNILQKPQDITNRLPKRRIILRHLGSLIIVGEHIVLKRRVFEIIFTILIGALTCYAFFCYFGIVVSSGLDLIMMEWISTLPESFQFMGIVLFEIVILLCSLIPVIAISGIVLGIVISRNPKIYALLACISAISYYIYLEFFKFDFGMIHIKYVPKWTYFIELSTWLILFVFFSTLGYKMKNSILPRRKGDIEPVRSPTSQPR